MGNHATSHDTEVKEQIFYDIENISFNSQDEFKKSVTNALFSFAIEHEGFNNSFEKAINALEKVLTKGRDNKNFIPFENLDLTNTVVELLFRLVCLHKSDFLSLQICRSLYKISEEDPTSIIEDAAFQLVSSAMSPGYQEKKQMGFRAMSVISAETIDDVNLDLFRVKYNLDGLMEILIKLLKRNIKYKKSVLNLINVMTRELEHNVKFIEAVVESGLFNSLLESCRIIKYHPENESNDGIYFFSLPPSGILHEFIFENLSLNDLVACHSVCKRWRFFARKTQLTTYNIYELEHSKTKIIDTLGSISAQPFGAYEILEKTDFQSIVRLLDSNGADIEFLRSILNLISRVSKNTAHGSLLIYSRTDALVNKRTQEVGVLLNLMKTSKSFNLRQGSFLTVSNLISVIDDPKILKNLNLFGVFRDLVEYAKGDASILVNLHSSISKNIQFQKYLVQNQIIPLLSSYLLESDNDVHKNLLLLFITLCRGLEVAKNEMKENLELSENLKDLYERTIWDPVRNHTSILAKMLGIQLGEGNYRITI